VNDLPHHFNDFSATLIIEKFIELTGEVIEIDRASLYGRSAIDQLAGGQIVQSETRFRHGVKFYPSGLRHFSIDGRPPGRAEPRLRGDNPCFSIAFLTSHFQRAAGRMP